MDARCRCGDPVCAGACCARGCACGAVAGRLPRGAAGCPELDALYEERGVVLQVLCVGISAAAAVRLMRDDGCNEFCFVLSSMVSSMILAFVSKSEKILTSSRRNLLRILR